MKASSILLLLLLVFAFNFQSTESTGGTFTIDESTKTFLLNGAPFRYVSGTIHYFRCHPATWEDIIKKLRAMGANAIQVYVEWRYHEETPGHFDFEGGKDIERFILLAYQYDLHVILRPGPFIDAERDMGGLPSWLLQLNPDVKLRTSDPNFMIYVERWFQVLYSKLAKFAIGNGGPIIMVQIENEYAFLGAEKGPDTEYLVALRDLAKAYFGSSVLLYSTDNLFIDEAPRYSKIPGVFGTVDFAAGENFTNKFHIQRLFEPNGPMVNSEFYVGWLDQWTKPHQTKTSSLVANSLDGMLALGANVNVYVAHGGTAFGFGAGSKLDDNIFVPVTTSYDFDAPINEAGDLTQKYFAIQNVVKKYLPIPDISVNKTSEKGNYGKVSLSPMHSLLYNNLENIDLEKNAEYPMSFEALGASGGIVVYETTVKDKFMDPAKLSVKGIRDRGYVFVDGFGPVGILDRMSDNTDIPLSIKPGQKLQIYVENLGRVCFGPNIKDFKGIISNVSLNNVLLKNWTMTPLPLTDSKELFNRILQTRNSVGYNKIKLLKALKQSGGSMSFWQGQFKGCIDGQPRDTFLDMTGWKKGYAFVNGFNLGRYWPVAGPQLTLSACSYTAIRLQQSQFNCDL